MAEVMYSEKVTVYMSYEQRREIERAAHAAHLKVSDWCRRELAAAVNRSKREQRNDKREGGLMDKNKDEKYDEIVATLQNLQEEIVATLQNLQEERQRLRWEVRILLLVGLGGMYVLKWPSICMFLEWFELFECF